MSDSKKRTLFLLNFLLFPYVLGHFDDQFCACEFVVVKKNCTAFRPIGTNKWQVHDPNTSGQYVSIVSPKNKADWNSLDVDTAKQIFEKEQFSHPIRAAIIEAIGLY